MAGGGSQRAALDRSPVRATALPDRGGVGPKSVRPFGGSVVPRERRIVWGTADQPNSRTVEGLSEASVLVGEANPESVLVEILGRVGGVAGGENIGKI